MLWEHWWRNNHRCDSDFFMKEFSILINSRNTFQNIFINDFHIIWYSSIKHIFSIFSINFPRSSFISSSYSTKFTTSSLFTPFIFWISFRFFLNTIFSFLDWFYNYIFCKVFYSFKNIYCRYYFFIITWYSSCTSFNILILILVNVCSITWCWYFTLRNCSLLGSINNWLYYYIFREIFLLLITFIIFIFLWIIIFIFSYFFFWRSYIYFLNEIFFLFYFCFFWCFICICDNFFRKMTWRFTSFFTFVFWLFIFFSNIFII